MGSGGSAGPQGTRRGGGRRSRRCSPWRTRTGTASSAWQSGGRCWSRQELRRIRRRLKSFLLRERDFDGRLSLEEFLGEETQIEKLFRMMDKNADRVITKKEFMTIGTKLSKDQVKLAFSQF